MEPCSFSESLEYAVDLDDDPLVVRRDVLREVEVCFLGRPIFDGLAAFTNGAMYSS